jgi:alkylhydroperoxidase/carboxymuconolactone decarboxylase family protein YurZ
MPNDIDDAAAVLRQVYDEFETSGKLREFLRSTFEADFAVAGYPTNSSATVEDSSAVSLYLSAIEKAFYQVLPAAGRVTNDDRERVLLALLASQGATGNLAIHVYLALMEKVPAVEVIDILFLSGIYSGVNRLTQSLKVADAVFNQVVKMAAAPPPTVPKALEQILANLPK